MWTRLLQAAALTSMLYLVVGMSKSPANPSITNFEVSRYIQQLLKQRVN